jgi:nucleoside-diphosphate-sugar epimerase
MEGLNLVGFDNRIDSGRIRAELGWKPLVGYAEATATIGRDWRAAQNG